MITHQHRRQLIYFCAAHALGVALLFALHDLYSNIHLKGNYTPFSASAELSDQVYDESQLYSTGPRRFMFFNSLKSETDVYEMRNYSHGYPILHSLWVGTMGKITHSLEKAWQINHFLLPTLAWILLFFLLTSVGIDRWLAAPYCWLTLIFPFSPLNSLLLGKKALLQPLEYSRLAHPALSFTVLLLAIFCFYRLITSGKRSFLFVSAFCGGLLWYSYYYYYIVYFLGLFVLMIFSYLNQRKELAKSCFWVGLLGTLQGIPYFMRLIRGANDGYQQNLLNRLGRVGAPPLKIGIIVAVIFLLLLWREYRKSDKSTSPSNELKLLSLLLLSFISAAGLGMNLHLVTDYSAQHMHFLNRAIQPLIFILLGVWALPKITSKQSKIILSLAAVTWISLAGFRQIYSARALVAEHNLGSPRNSVLRWIEENTPADAVVGTLDRELTTLIPGVSGRWTFIPIADCTMAKNYEIELRIIALAKLTGLNLEEVNEYLRFKPNLPIFAQPAYAHLMQFSYIYSDRDRMAMSWNETNPQSFFKERKLDYLIVATHRNLKSVFDSFPGAHQVYQNQAWEVLALAPSPLLSSVK